MKGINIMFAIFGLMTSVVAQNDESNSTSAYWSDGQIMKGGFFIDGNLGYMNARQKDYYAYYAGSYHRQTYSNQGMGIGLNLGGKFYFNESETHRHGLSFSGGFNIYINNGDYFNPSLIVSPLNLGFTNIWKLSEIKAVETNLNFGPKLYATRNQFMAIAINPEVRFRMKKFTLGVGYSMDVPASTSRYETCHTLNLIVGIR